MAAISIDGTPMTALPSDADQINYDNSNSRLSDTQVQDAIDTLANDSSTFVGTTTQWDNLTTAQKKAYKYRLLTDDYTDASIGSLSALHTTDKSSVVGAVNEVKDGLIKVVSGTETFTDVSPSTSENLTVYPQGIVVAHAVTCLDADGVMTNTACGVRNITTNSIKIYARNNGSTAATIKVMWVAFGS